MFYVWLRRHREVSAGLFGAGLVLVLGPMALGIQLALGKMLWTPAVVAVGLPATIGLYYLAWKHFVARLNDVLGIG
jgi:hypothetical protein